MKVILAVVQPPKLESIRGALERIEVTRLTLCDAQGYGRQQGHGVSYRGHEYTAKLLRKAVFEIVVNDDFLERSVNTIVQVARTGTEGAIGDGKIFILPVEQAIQIEDGTRGPGAV
ncbi:MAG: P-II family nitrogen regulator [Thermogutta sp.]